MAHYDVHHNCGHTSLVQMEGSMASRYARQERLAEQPCPDCRTRARTETAVATVEAARGDGWTLPALTGSDKQIGWAETLRAEFVRRVQAVVADRRPSRAYPLKLQLADRLEAAARAVCVTQTTARWWIDERGASVTQMARVCHDCGADVSGVRTGQDCPECGMARE